MKMIKWLSSALLICCTTLIAEQTVCIDEIVANLQESATLYSQKIVKNRKKEHQTVYNWGLGASPFDTPEIIVNALKENATKKQYSPVEGVPGLADIIVSKYNSPTYPIDPHHVIISNGLKQILYDVQKVFGGEIIHIAPYWVSYGEQVALLGKKPVIIETKFERDFKLTADEIEAVCKKNPNKPRMLIFNNPVNPTGASYTKEELQSLAAVCSKYQIIVFADEVYLGLNHNGERLSISTYLPDLTIRATSLSKEFAAGGYRVDWATFPKRLHSLKK